MWSRSAIKVTGAALLLGVTLSGCSDIYFERRDTVSVVSGEAMAANRVTHMIDPWPRASGNRNIAYNGEKAALAAECYRTGRVTTPIGATTSSAQYAQLVQRDKCTHMAPAAPAPISSSNKL
jgi:hypothetical protein